MLNLKFSREELAAISQTPYRLIHDFLPTVFPPRWLPHLLQTARELRVEEFLKAQALCEANSPATDIELGAILSDGQISNRVTPQTNCSDTRYTCWRKDYVVTSVVFYNNTSKESFSSIYM